MGPLPRDAVRSPGRVLTRGGQTRAPRGGQTRAPRGELTRGAILDAARGRFAAYGFRRTSMEDIAVAAGVSRATVYFHLGGKEDVFRALSAQLHEECLAAMAAAAAGDHPDVRARILAMLEARFAGFVAITHGSPHGAEIVEEGGRLSVDTVAEAGERTLALLGGVLRAAARAGELDLRGAGLSAPAAAQLLVDAAHGAKADPAISPDAFRRRLAAIVHVLVRGLRPD